MVSPYRASYKPQGDLKKFYRLFEDENSYILEVRNGFASYDAVMMEIPEDDEELNEIRTPSVGLSDIAAEAVALERIGLIDLNNNDTIGKVDEYVEVAKQASRVFDEKVKGLNNYGKDSETFASNLFNNFDDVINVVNEAKDLGTKTDTTMNSLLEDSQNAEFIKELIKIAGEIGAKDKENLRPLFQNADKADELKAVVDVAAEIGAKDKENLQAVFQNADKAVELKQVLDVARETLGEDDGLGGKKLDSSKASILLSTFKNADKADSMKSVMDDAKNLGLQDATYLTGVFENADIADDLRDVIENAKVIVCYAADYIGPVLKNTPQVNSLNRLLTTLYKVETDNKKLAALYKNAKIADEMIEVIDKAEEISDEKLEELQKAFAAVALIEDNLSLEEKFALALRNAETLIEHKADPLDILLSSVNSGSTGTWSSDGIIVEGTSLEFSGDASAKGDVVLENVTHSAVSDLNSTELKLYTEQY